ncbi:MAG TPA: TldD/PmbA family protein [Candidatus Rubrimentiphilum sp.]|nr:TldD/PmbA family protein [Candidatus Rubrimentiphilum sp.]
MDSKAREALAERALSLSTADHTEVTVATEDADLTRFTHEEIHQNVARSDAGLSVRAILGKRTGTASTNVLDEESLRATVDRAIAIATLAPEDPDLAPLPSGGPTTTPQGAFVKATADASPQLRAGMADAIFKVAESHKFWCAGFVRTQSAGYTIANSSGARASFDGTDSGINVKMTAADSTGYGQEYSPDATTLDAHAVASTAAGKAKNSAQPRAVDPGEWTVIMEPAAFGEFFAYLAQHFSAQSYDEGSSFLSDGLDKNYFGEHVSITDDYSNPLAPSMPFDFEGQPKQRVKLVEAGVAKSIVTDSYWAKKLGRENTGHALPAPNPYGPQAIDLVVSPGSKSTAQLIAETKRGLLISRFWYIRTVDQKKAIVTGMTRDGTFLIENGKVTSGVRNMRFNQSIITALGKCEFSNTQQRTGDYWFSLVVPAAKIESFTFSSGTQF